MPYRPRDTSAVAYFVTERCAIRRIASSSEACKVRDCDDFPIAKLVGKSDIKQGFRYAFKGLDRVGIKTVNGNALAEE